MEYNKTPWIVLEVDYLGKSFSPLTIAQGIHEFIPWLEINETVYIFEGYPGHLITHWTCSKANRLMVTLAPASLEQISEHETVNHEIHRKRTTNIQLRLRS